MNTAEEFKQHKYLDVKSFIPQDLCKIAANYALLKEKITPSPEEGADAQVRGAHAAYGDTLMETLMHFCRPHLEKLTGLDLAPTYTYYRVYRPGAELFRHKDRPSCEISMTVCLKFNYIGTPPGYNWGMYVDPESPKIPHGPNGEFISNNQPGKMICQNAGDVIVYRGCEIEHWRDKFQAEPESYQVQAFFHYIDKNGPHYPVFLYDQRPGIGYSEYSRNNSQ
jgi:hypothetical protein